MALELPMPPQTVDNTVLNELTAIVGAPHVHTGTSIPDRLIEEPRKRFRSPPMIAVRPADCSEISRIVRLCAQHGLRVISRGGGSGTVGGASAIAEHPAQIVVSLDRMRALRSIDNVSGSLTAEAGMPLAKAREHAQQKDL